MVGAAVAGKVGHARGREDVNVDERAARRFRRVGQQRCKGTQVDAGRFDLAAAHYEKLRPHIDRPGQREMFLAWAAGFSLAMATGETSAAPPFPPLHIGDPVAGVAATVIRAELALAGRIDEALDRYDRADRSGGAVADVAGVFDAFIPMPAEARGVAELILLRAHACAGSAVALTRLREGASRLRMPSVIAGVGVPSA